MRSIVGFDAIFLAASLAAGNKNVLQIPVVKKTAPI